MPTEGLKADLVNRLQARLDEEEFGELDDEPATTAATAGTATGVTAATERKKANRNAPDDGTNTATSGKPATAETNIVADEKAETKVVVETDATAGDSEIGDVAGAAASLKAPTPAADLASEEMKRKRAMRFNIPVVSSKPTPKEETGKETKGTRETRSKRLKPGKVEEPALLPLEEIETLLKRAEKYGAADQARIDELKAMKRKYRF